MLSRLPLPRLAHPLCGWAAASLAVAVSWHGQAAIPNELSPEAAPPPPPTIYIREYRVVGARDLPKIEVAQTVYPFLGPGRTLDDVEQARAALEKAYQDKGFQGVQVLVPPQPGRGGVVFLQVNPGKLGQLRVKGARYFLPSAIKARARSLAEGKVVNFNDVNRDITALNTLADRQVTPSLRAGLEPGTVDVDLTVKDKLPLHASLELNNRNNPNTSALRLSANANYNNLWQLGHTVGFGYQVAPERRLDAEIFSGYYIARFPGAESFSLMLQGRKQNSKLLLAQEGEFALLGTNNVVAPGHTIGVRAIFTLPPGPSFIHSFTFGIDYGNYRNEVFVTGPTGRIPLLDEEYTYFPITATYSATWTGQSYTTDFNAQVVFGIRGSGTDRTELELNRPDADENFVRLRADLSHTHDLPYGLEGFVRLEGQVADRPLVNTEQIAGGGLQSVRGYLEGEVLADNGIFGTVELRSPSLLGFLGKTDEEKEKNEWRVYLFADAGYFSFRSTPSFLESEFQLASFGIGTRMRLLGHLNGSLDAAIPLTAQTETESFDPHLTFRVWADF